MTDKTIKTELVYYSTKSPADHELLKALGEIPFSTWKVDMVYPNGTANTQGRKFRESLLRKLGIDLSKAAQADGFVCSREVNLEVQNLFDNQWNTAEGFRLFNKVEFVWPNASIYEGYYLRQTPEMVAILTGTAKCGYCGHMAPVGEKDFCDKCLSSPHLSEENLHLLRMRPIEEPGLRETVKSERQRYRKHAPLSEQERETLLPRYVEAQTNGKCELAQKAISDAYKKYARKLILANVEYDGMRCIAKAGIPLDNVIFYEHNETFCFGWRNGLSDEVKEVLKEKLKDFPYNVELK